MQTINFEVSFKILSTKVWPFSHEGYIKSPKQIQDVEDAYTVLYKERHPNRLLKWVYSKATCVLKVNYLGRPLDIETTQTAAIILLYFNDNVTLHKRASQRFSIQPLEPWLTKSIHC